MSYNRLDDNYMLMWAKRIKAIKLLGGVCKKCSNDDIFVLDFHHVNKGKEINLNKIRNNRWSSIEQEINKCILLCANCHQELHYSLNRGRALKIKLFNDLKIDTKCSSCGYYGGNLSSLCFHHYEDNKEFNISWAFARKVNGRGICVQNIIDEIHKCSVICFNCHRITHINFEKFSKFKKDIYNKVRNYKEQNKIDINIVAKMKYEGKGICKIARELGVNKSTIFYNYHKC